MTYSEALYVGNGVTVDYGVTFDYLDQSHVYVSVDKEITTAVGSEYKFEFINSSTVRVRTVVNENPVPSGLEVRVFRQTPIDEPAVVFGGGASLSSANLNKNSEYLTFALQEAADANQEFTKVYLGAFAVEPTSDNEGETLRVGSVYFDTRLSALFYWSGTAWIIGESVTVSSANAADAAASTAVAVTQAGIATTQAGTATTQAGISTTQAGIATTAAASAALFDGPKFDTIALAAAFAGYEDGDYAVINPTGERLEYVEASTATADGALIVTATGMGVGRLISTRTEFATFAAFIADNRTFTAGTTLTIPSIGGLYQATDSTGNLGLTNAGGQEFDVQFINGDVRAFGAVGDGVTDDSAAVALAQAASDCVIFTADTYYMGTSAWKPTANKTYIFQNTTLLFDVSNDAAVQIGMRTHFLGHLIIDANEAASSVALRFGPESGGVIGPCYDSVVDSVRVTGFTSVGIQFRSDGNSGVYYCKIGKAEVFNYSLNTSSPANADATAKAGIGVQFITDSGVGKVNSNLIEYATVIGYTTGVQVSNGEGNAFGYLNAETNLTMNLDIVEALGFKVCSGRLENKCTIGFAGNLSIADGVDATGISINATITGFDQPTGALQAINFSNLRSVDIATQRYKYLLGRTLSENIEIGSSGTAKDDDSKLDGLRVSGGQYCYRLSTGNPYYFFTAPTDGVGYVFRDNGSRILSQIDGGNPASGRSSLRVLVNDGTNPVRLERVRIGEPDSGGTGYRALVISNS